MKKVTSIFLLFIMLVVSVHPVLAVHFCGGKLNSFSILNNDMEKSCCGEKEISPHSDVAFQTLNKSSRLTHLLSDNKCCKTQKINISTNDYQYHIQRFNLKNNTLSAWVKLWIVPGLLSIFENNNVIKTNFYFPPGTLHLQNTDLLSFICIYRI